MRLRAFLAQVVEPGTAPPVDDGNWGIAIVVATLITLGIMFLVCSPLRRD
jgi:hypothetical protein